MKIEKLIWISILTLALNSCGFINPYFRINKLIDKGKYDLASFKMAKIKTDSTKVLEESYTKARHYKLKNSPFYNIDSSYTWNQLGLSHWDKTDNWKKKIIIRKSGSLNPFQNFKIEIDSIAFSDALEKNSEKEYQHYINIYSESPYIGKAVVKRDSLAFSKAKSENTYISYKSFLEKYPESRQAEEAKEIYDLLLYETHTRDKHRESYENFIEKFPHSPYLNEAVAELFDIYTLDHQKESYEYFLEKFPNTLKSDEANLWIKHLEIDSTANDLFFIVPSERKNKLKFFNPDSSGIDFYFDSLENISICTPLFSPFQIYYSENKQGLVNSSGQGLIPALFNDLNELSSELYSYSSKNKMGLVHVSGFMITDPIYDSITILNDTFLRAFSDEVWKILSYNGKILLNDTLSQIDYLGNDIILLKKGEKKALIKGNTLLNWPDRIKTNYDYDSIYRNRNGHICLLKGENSTVLKANLKALFNETYETFEQVKTYYIFKNGDMNCLTSKEGELLVDWTKNSIYVNQFGFAQFDNIHWSTNFFNHQISDVDSFKSFLPYFVRIWKKDSIIIQNSHAILNLEVYDEFKIENDPNKFGENYFLVKKDSKWGLIDNTGRLLLEPKFEEIKLFPTELIRVKYKGKFGLKNLNSLDLLKPEYEAISNFKDGGFTLFKSSKFGYINPSKKITIKTSHKSPPEYVEYQYPLYLKTDNSLMSYYDLKNDKKLIEAKNLEKVNDSLFFANQNFQWVLNKISEDGKVSEMNLKCESYKLWEDGKNQNHIIFDYNSSTGFFDIENNLKIYPEYYKIYPILNKEGEISIYLTFKYFEEIEIYLLKIMDRDENEMFKTNIEADWLEQFQCEDLHEF